MVTPFYCFLWLQSDVILQFSFTHADSVGAILGNPDIKNIWEFFIDIFAPIVSKEGYVAGINIAS